MPGSVQELYPRRFCPVPPGALACRGLYVGTLSSLACFLIKNVYRVTCWWLHFVLCISYKVLAGFHLMSFHLNTLRAVNHFHLSYVQSGTYEIYD